MLSSSRDISRRSIIILFVLLTVIGLISGYSYSMSIDADVEYNILRSNIAEYILRLFGENSPISTLFGGRALPISQSIEQDHGISAFYIIAPFCILANKISHHARILVWHSWTFLLFMTGVYSIYGIARNLFHRSRLFSFASSLLLYLTPKMFAEGHYNNKDVVLLSLSLLVIHTGICFIQKNRLRDAVFFSIAGAFCANTKIIGAWTWGLFGLLYLLRKILCQEMSFRTWRNGCAAIAVFITGYVILTPAMWNDPLEFISYLLGNALQFSRWNYFVLFEGNVTSYFTGETLPWYYLPKLMFMTIPILILLFFLIGLVMLIIHLIKYKGISSAEQEITLTSVTILLSGLVPLLIGMFSGMIVYNGWRHFYFVYGSILLLSIYAIHYLTLITASHVRMHRLFTCLLTAYFFYQSSTIIMNHPLQGSYFNPLAAPYVESNYEADYWLLSTAPAANGIMEHTKSHPGILPTCTSNPFMNGNVPSYIIDALPVSDLQYVTDIDSANYYIEYADYASIIEKLPREIIEQCAGIFSSDAESICDWNADQSFVELFSIQSYGIETCTVYIRKQVLQTPALSNGGYAS